MPTPQRSIPPAADRAEIHADRSRQRVLAAFVVLWLAVGALCVLLAIFTPSP